jgi:hypothetical protein
LSILSDACRSVVSAMSFERQKPGQSADERLAQLLSEEPIKVGVVNVRRHEPYDVSRAFVIALLLTSVAGTWSVAYFL